MAVRQLVVAVGLLSKHTPASSPGRAGKENKGFRKRNGENLHLFHALTDAPSSGVRFETWGKCEVPDQYRGRRLHIATDSELPL